MKTRLAYIVFVLNFLSIICVSQNLPAEYGMQSEKEIEHLYFRLLRDDRLEFERLKNASLMSFMSASSYNKIKSIARNIKLANKLTSTTNTQLTELNYINSKLESYKTNYGATVFVKFSSESFQKFKTDLTKVLLTLFSDPQAIENCIVVEVYGTHNGNAFNDAVGYKLHALGEYAQINAISNYNKLFQNPTKSYQKEIFEDLDALLFQNQEALENASLQNAPVIGEDLLITALQSAGLNACAFCKVCSQSNPQSGSGAAIQGDGFSAPIRIIRKDVSYSCVIATYNSSNSTVVTALPSNFTPNSFGNNKIVPKGEQFIVLRKTQLNEDEYTTCLATQTYNDYCTSTNPFASQTFKDKIALEIQSCAQQDDAAKQALLSKFSNLNAKSTTYLFEGGYLVTKYSNGQTTIKSYSQSDYNELVRKLKSGQLSNDQAIVFKKTSGGYDVKVNFGSNVHAKQGYEMNETAIDKSELAFETVMNEYLLNRADLSLMDIQNGSQLFEDGKKIDVKQCTVWDKIQNGVSATREFIEQAKITEKYYNSAAQEYPENWVNTPPMLSGVGNGVIEEIKEIPQLVFLACDIATKEEVRTRIWNGLKGLNLDKIKKAASSTLSNWTDTYSQGGDVAWHQGGKDGVMVFSMLSPMGFVKNADDALSKNVDDVADNIRKKTNPIEPTKFLDVDDFAATFDPAKKLSSTIRGDAWNYFKQGKWKELEEIFKTNNVNGGWPPNRGFIRFSTKNFEINTTFDRYGGYFENGVFKDKGTFASPLGATFESRALPASTLNKPYRKYKVLKQIPNVKSGEAIPWFDQVGNGIQFELPESIDDLISGGFIEVIN
ncbi:MAG: TNT domain-containing protein [Bacteroidia bacterium]|nr:TNT domain-containing protein [Bacteroidia bacterium]